MIKVNLLKNKGSIDASVKAASATPQITLDAGFKTDAGSNAQQLQAALKIILMLGFAAGLFAYEKVLNKRAARQVASIQSERDRLEELRVEKEEKANNLPEIQGKFDFLNERSKEFKNATRLRLAELEALDAIQSSITREAWLSSLKYKDGILVINGSSFSGQGFDEFNANLERQQIFKSVRYNKVSDSANNSDGGLAIIEFQLTAEIDEDYLSGR